MSMKRKTFQCLLILIIGLCISTALLPYIILSTGSIRENTPPTSVSFRKPSSRKALDVKEKNRKDSANEQELNDHITELRRITVSVRNELREIEQQRVKIVEDTEHHKSMLFQLQESIANAKKQLQITQAELAKISHEIYSVKKTRTDNSGHFDITKAPPIYILPQAPVPETRPHPLTTHSFDCNRNDCLNYSRCPSNRPFKVFVYNKEGQNELRKYLKDINSYADNINEACLIVNIHSLFSSSLPSTLFTEGENNILTISLTPAEDHTLKSMNRHMRVSPQPLNNWRHGHDIIAPPTPNNTVLPIWKDLPPIVPAFRRHLLYFEGQYNGKITYIIDWLHRLQSVLNINSSANILTTCSSGIELIGRVNGWSLCRTSSHRSEALKSATFSLILSSESLSDYHRLSESLRYGSIPVIIGPLELPFQTVLDWSKISIRLPYPLLHEIHYYMRGISHDEILSMRRLGRFIWETYFSSTLQIIKSCIAIVRYRLYHLPPVASEVTPKQDKVFGGDKNVFKFQTFTGNSSVYNSNFWNWPPGPFYMYPHNPLTQPPPISGSLYPTLSKNELFKLPPHIIQAGGITGPYFQNYLLGNVPEEYFTVVMLTYRREEVVKESVERLRDLDHLAKVILVWNDPDSDPFAVDWPSINVPLQIVWAETNSLNNRFLPFNSIETEAILSIDDDVYLRHDEIQFAFRVWRESRDRLVGFPGRFHSYDIRHGSWLYNSNYTCELSMVLTGAAFFHKYYSYLYTFWQPEAVREMVNEKMNCEDIAMNFLVAHITRKPPLKVTSRWTFRCPSCPDTLSQSDVHFDERHNCMNHLTKIYGYTPLLYTQYRLDSVLFKTRLPSHLEKCYQYV